MAKKKRGTNSKRIAAILLSGLMSFGNLSPVHAEETTSPATSEPTVTETTQPSEQPEETAAPVTTEPAATAESTASPSAQAETPEPSATTVASPSPSATAEASVSPTIAPTDAPNASASAEPSATPTAETDEKVPAYNVYKAEDIVDYVSAMAAMPDDTDYTMIVRTFDDLSQYLSTGVGVYFDGTYTLEFASRDLMDEAERIITEKLGDVIVRNEAMSVDTDENDTSTSESAPNENPDPLTEVDADADVTQAAEETMSVAEKGKKDDDKVVIALIDSGVNDGYADASVNLTTDPDADANGHGTKMASIIKKWAGDKASILSIKAFNDDGTGSIATVTAAVKYATIMNVDIIHISASILDSDNTVYFNEAIENAVKSGIKVVASAGNDGVKADAYTPAKLDGVDTIGAAEPLDGATAFRATEFSNYGDAVNYYYIADSTSEAAAHETGLLAAGVADEMMFTVSSAWLRFTQVKTKDDPDYSDTSEMKFYTLDELKSMGRISQENYDYLLEKEKETFTLNVAQHACDLSGRVCVDRVKNSSGTDWDYKLSTFTIDGHAAQCNNPGEKTYVEQARYTCTVTGGSSGITYNGDTTDGRVIEKEISFNGASIGAYDPTQVYTWTDSSGHLAEGGYNAPGISVGSGDSTKVHASISGNTLKVWFDADENADMPDDITITIDGGNYKAATKHHCEGGSAGSAGMYCSAAGSQPISYGGSSGTPGTCYPGEDGYDYKSARVHLNILRGNLEVSKGDFDTKAYQAQGDATLAGAVFSLYRGTSAGTKLTDVTTGTDGTAVFSNLKWGAYTVRETQAPIGYDLNNDPLVFHVNQSGVTVNSNRAATTFDKGQRFGFEINKHDADTYEYVPEGDATLAGATYAVYNVSKASVYYKGKLIGTQGTGTPNSVTITEGALTGTFQYGNGNYVDTIVTDAKGHASISDLPYGSYIVVESKAPEGYLMENPSRNGEAYVAGVFAEGGAVHTNSVNMNHLTDDVKRGQLIVGKVDHERMNSDPKSPDDGNIPQGDATMQGAEFTIYLRTGNPVVVDGKKYNAGDAVKTIVSGADGIAQTPRYSLPYGSYTVKETKAPAGYFLNEEWSIDFEITEEGQVKNFAQAGEFADRVQDQIFRGSIELTKNDLDRYISKDASANTPQGNGSLEGVEFTIYNVSNQDVLVGSKYVEPNAAVHNAYTAKNGVRAAVQALASDDPSVVLKIVTNESGFATTAGIATLPYGTYAIKETSVPEENHYKLNDYWYSIIEVREDGVTYDAAQDNKMISDQAYDGAMVDEINRSGGIFLKIDQERDTVAGSPDATNVAQGDATLAGAEITIYNISDKDIYGASKQNSSNPPSYDGKTSSDGNKGLFHWVQTIVRFFTGKSDSLTDEGKVVSIYTDEQGYARIGNDTLPAGTYAARETKPSKGYLLNEDWVVTFTITDNGEIIDLTDHDSQLPEKVIRGGIEITKFDTDREIIQDSDQNKPQGDATLAGAEYTIYNISTQDGLIRSDGTTKNANEVWKETAKSEISDRASTQKLTADDERAVWTLVTDENGYATTESNSLPYGTYLIKETKAPEGYILNDYWYSIVEVRENGKIYDAVDANTKKSDQVYSGTAVDDVVRGGVKFQKTDTERDTAVAQGDATLEGAEITIYNISKMDVYGARVQNASKAPQYDGKISPEGNKAQFKFVETGDSPTTSDDPRDADVLHYLAGENASVPTVVGENAESGMSAVDGTYAYITNNGFANSRNTAYDDALATELSQSDKFDVRTFENAQPVLTIKTDATGLATTGAEALPYGTYVAVETKPSRGYNLNMEWIVTFEIREDGVIVDATGMGETDEHAPDAKPLDEQVIRGDVRIYKEDLEMSELNGVSRSNYGYKSTTNKTDDSMGIGSDSSYGDETVKTKTTETSRYLLGSESAHHAGTINGEAGEIAADAENNPSQAIGGKNHSSTVSSLNGIEFTITNVSTLSVLSDADQLKEYKPGEFVTTITTHYDAEIDTDGDGVADSSGYIAETTGKALPYGTYTIQETKTNDAYMLTDGTPRTFEIEYEGEIADTTKQTHHTADAGEELVFRNQIRRGDFDFVKIAAHTADRVQSLWVLENDTSGEKHVIVTDKNGEFQSYSYSHSDETNNNDSLLDVIGTDYEKMIDLTGGLADGTIKEFAGVWFGMGEDGAMAKVNDRLGALPYGQYTLHEVRTNTNDGKDLLDVTFYIVKNSTFNASGVIEKDSAVHLGTLIDEGPSIKTAAVADDSGNNVGSAGETKAIIDTITYRDLETGDYTLKTSLVNAASGAVLTDAEGNDLVKEEAVSVTKTDGTMKVTFDVDTSEFGGLDVVVFEELYHTDEDGELVRVAGHVDRLDSKQTISFPGIHTTLADTTKKETNPAEGMYYLTDTVTYNGLDVGKTYTMTGTLHLKNADGTDAGELKDADGNVITASTDFKTKSANGSVAITFEIPRSLLEGETVVAFETLTQGQKQVAVHANINDHDQTVTISKPPVIHTTAINKADGTKNYSYGDALEVVDTVSYSNLVPGKTYTLYGEVHWKETAVVASDEPHVIDGGVLVNGDKTPVAATVTFTPDSENGTQDVEFKIDASALPGDIVVFETLYEGDKAEGEPVATHADITDNNQTLSAGHSVARLQTTAVGNGMTSADGKTAEIIDTVSYSGLEAGAAYHLAGTLHIKNADGSDGGVLKDADGNSVTSSVDFTPDRSAGTQDVKFSFSTSLLKNVQSVVVFEDLYTSSQMNEDGTVRTGETPYVTHSDINDEGQTVTVEVPEEIKLSTTATGTGMKAVNGETAEIKDVVTYSGLEAGTAYHLVGTLHIKNADGSDGGALKNADGTVITASADFAPAESSGTAEVKFSFSASLLKNVNSLVVFEDLYAGSQLENGSIKTGETPIATHSDISDSGQTVDVEAPDEIKISTTATGKGLIAIDGRTAEIKDVVSYSGLEAGTAYHLVGTLHIKNDDGTDGGALKSAAGSAITASADFTPTASKGTAEVTFSFSASLLKNVHSLVVFEDLYTEAQLENGSVKKGETPVASHSDISDKKQTVEVTGSPEIKTTAVNKATNGKTVVRGDSVTIVDTVAYTGLVPGQKYKLVGELHTAKDKILAISGKPLTVEYTFTPDKADGSVSVTFTSFSTKTLDIGQKIVVFETLTPIDSEGRAMVDDNGTKQLVHEDMKDEGQTVTVVTVEAKIHTTARTKDDKQTVVQGNKVKITDTVKYEGLVVGQRYRVTGEIHTSDTVALASGGKKIEQSVTFVAKSSDGSVDVTFDEFSTETLEAGTKLVVFETLTPVDENGHLMTDDHGISKLEHKDMKDKDQTITVTEKPGPAIHTNAVFKDTNSKNMKTDANTGSVTINDTVTYENLVPGTKYVLYGTLMDKATGQAISATSALEFTPDQANGSIVVPIQVDGSKLIGKTGVVFEELRLKDKNTVVAEHKDIYDADQTVVFADTSFTPTDAGRGVMIAGIAAIVACVALIIIKRKKKQAE